MAINQDVKIDIKLKAHNKKALEQIGTSLLAIKGSAESLDSELEQIDESLDDWSDSFGKDDDLQIGGKVDAKSIEDAVTNARQEANRLIGEHEGPKISVGAEVDVDGDELGENLKSEIDALDDIKERADAATESKERFAEENGNVKERALASVTALDKEEQSFSDIIDTGDDLTDVKQKVAGANKHVQKMSEESAKELDNEDGSMMSLFKSMNIVEEASDDLSDTTRTVARSVRRMKTSTDASTDSMRAAAEVGDLFEDGLGSLSVNLGAFTIALRNFLTQVPLLLTALGALGAAALGAAASFSALAGAMGGLLGAGLIAEAQSLNKEFSELEGLGESLQVIMKNVADVFLEAINPLTELSNSSDFFKETVEGLASGVNMLSNAIAFLTTGSDEFVNSSSEIFENMFTIQDAIDSFNGKSWEALIESIMISWALLGEEVTWALGAINHALADAIIRSSQLLAEVENVSGAVSQFSKTMSELAELGFTIGSGLLPVFESFSATVESVASAINEMDDEMVANLVTFAAIFMATQKVAGTMASMVRVIPSVVTGLRSISTASAGADTALGGMKVAMTGVMSNVGQFLTTIGAFGGISELMLALDSTGEAFKEIAFNSVEAQAQFKALALGSDVTADELSELATKGLLTEKQIDALADETNELNDELMKTQLNASLAGESFDDIDADDIDVGNVDVDTNGIIDPSQFRNTSDATEKLDDDLAAMAGGLDGGAESSTLMSKAMYKLNNATGKTGKAVYGVKRATNLLKTATMSWIGGMNAAIGTIIVKIGALLGLTKAEASATTATMALDMAFTSLTGGLSKIIPAIIGLIVVLGALTVGILKNMDGIKSAFSDMFQVVKAIVGGVVDILMVTFMSTWDALRMTIEPLLRPIKTIMMAFGGTGDAAEESSDAISILSTAFEALLGIISFTIRSIGVIGKLITTIFIIPFEGVAIAIGAVIDLLQWVSGKIGTWVASWSVFQDFFDDTSDSTVGLIDVISTLFDHTLDVMQSLTQRFENFINNAIIGGINDVISMINNVPGFNVAQMSEIDITRDEGIGTEEPEVDPKRDNTITYNEDNSTNIDQTIDADPEDQAQLSRVVSDAIAEANSFERRRAGGQ